MHSHTLSFNQVNFPAKTIDAFFERAQLSVAQSHHPNGFFTAHESESCQ